MVEYEQKINRVRTNFKSTCISSHKREALNPEYFSRLFARETGKKVSEYITDAKVRTAMNMLAHSDYSIMDIALSLGYSSQSAFTTVFKKHTSMTPKKYRDVNKGKM